MNRFNTLLQREWMQHQRGWLILMGLPTALFLLIVVLGQWQFSLGDNNHPQQAGLLVQALAAVVGTAITTLALAWLTANFQAPGLARRDQQDRSIEFWLSLPTPPAQSVAATVLAHLLLVPWLALAAGLLGGAVVATAMAIKLQGLGGLWALPWGDIIPAVLALFLRLSLGLLLATLWLSPLTLATMAASAWLKRWGLPVVVLGVASLGLLLDKLWGTPVVWQLLGDLGHNAGQAFLHTSQTAPGSSIRISNEAGVPALLQLVPSWALSDAGRALQALAQPLFLGAMLVAAGCFALLVWRRQRGS